MLARRVMRGPAFVRFRGNSRENSFLRPEQAFLNIPWLRSPNARGVGAMWQSSGLGSGRTPRDRSSNAGSRPGSAVKRLNLELNFETRSGRSTPGGSTCDGPPPSTA